MNLALQRNFEIPMRALIRSILFLSILLLPFTTIAHGYWFEIEGSHKLNEPVTVKLYFGDFPAGIRSSGQALDKVKDITVSVAAPGAEKQQIVMKQTPDYWEGSFTPKTEGTYEITGINDIREVQDWTKHELGIVRPIQYMKVNYAVGDARTQQASANFIDMAITEVKSNNYTLHITKGGKLLAKQKILLSSFGGKEYTVETNAKGDANIELENAALYVFSIDWIDKTQGTFKDKKYETVRHRLDVSLYK